MPLAVMVLGVAGAFITTSMSSTKALANVQGYRFVSQADPCHLDLMCSNVVTANVCTSGSNQLWGKTNPSAATCQIPLYKIQN
ncbi:hypothetical protein IWX84_000681 [Flavobacterium sp. CG_9.10]|uniref:hypothetical protein n=1 Tax=Flavobacterium sp. CG_9.10 TaxID=2787729 RepID=UPI001A290509|nr:hypothetical protein [Flavobacterium sp. CG_9.10]MBG6109820.1 hypothetical protein [Flavobacterium sp. CG_9.10]